VNCLERAVAPQAAAPPAGPEPPHPALGALSDAGLQGARHGGPAAPAIAPPIGSIWARRRAAASSIPVTSPTSLSRTSSSNPSARTGSKSSTASPTASSHGPLDRLRSGPQQGQEHCFAPRRVAPFAKSCPLDWPATGESRESFCLPASRRDPRDLQAGWNLSPNQDPAHELLGAGIWSVAFTDPSSGQGVAHDNSRLGQPRTTSGDASEGVAVAVSALTFAFEHSWGGKHKA